MPQGPKILQTRSLARSRCFHIEQMDLRFSNGTEVQYERISSSPRGAVLIIPMLDKYTVLLIREYAGGTQRYELGLPKGRIEPNEPVEEAANREMMEEVGYAGRRFDRLPSMTIAPGYISHVSHPVLVRDLY
ncbi:MAG: ADP compounds hydrolase NudE, partial [Gammaproteobacteria bacterium]